MNSEQNELGLADRIRRIIRSLKPTEKVVFGIFAALFAVSAFYMLQMLNLAYSVEVPAYGGTYQEGVVGYARFINPVLSFTDADKDMSALIYSGLLKPTPEGKLDTDLAQSWSVSDDELTYTFTLKPNLYFHDGQPLTTADIAYTIEKILDPAIKSPKAESWNGVTVTVIDDKSISFTLKKPYAPFIENLTLGILPKHLWKDVSDDTFDVSVLNREPVGSGPFQIAKAFKDDSGIYEYYDLSPFDKYALGKPYISHFIMRFYKGESDALGAYKGGRIDGLGGISPQAASEFKKSGDYLLSTSLPRVFAVFLNESAAPVLVNKEVRQALDVAVNRSAIIKDVLDDWGTPSRTPLPRKGTQELSANSLASSPSDNTASSTAADPYVTAAAKILAAGGWKMGDSGVLEKKTISGKTSSVQTLKFSISAPNVPELTQTANILKETWGKLGADVTVQIFEPSDLTQKVIRPRSYDSLLFGQVVGRDFDLYPFWHSSQRNDPGLNIALYTNIKADKALEIIRGTSDEAKRQDAYKTFEQEIENDIPAIFLYSPDYIYAASRNVRAVDISNITSPSERFMNVYKWYTETDRVWKVFSPNLNTGK